MVNQEISSHVRVVRAVLNIYIKEINDVLETQRPGVDFEGIQTRAKSFLLLDHGGNEGSKA